MLIQVKSTVALVDECYPSECVKFQTVLDPSQTRFRVNGTPNPSAVEEPPAPEVVEQSSIDSLPLKPPKGKEQQTPTQSEQLSNGQNGSGAAYNQQPNQQPYEESATAREEVPVRERDVLDDIIDEAKIVKDLVGCLKCFLIPS